MFQALIDLKYPACHGVFQLSGWGIESAGFFSPGNTNFLPGGKLNNQFPVVCRVCKKDAHDVGNDCVNNQLICCCLVKISV